MTEHSQKPNVGHNPEKFTAHHTFITCSSKLQTFTTDYPFKVFQLKFCYVFLIQLIHYANEYEKYSDMNLMTSLSLFCRIMTLQ
jgi:hypothetical protein